MIDHSQSGPSNILVRVPNWMGDAVMCIPALYDLRDRFPDAKLTILARPHIRELLHGQPCVDEVLVYQYQKEHKGLLGLYRLILEVRAKGFDQAILFQNAFEAAVIVFFAAIPSRVGYATDGRGWLLSQKVPRPSGQSFHHITYYQRLVRERSDVLTQDRAPHIFLPKEEDRLCRNQFPEIFQSSVVLVGINPGSVYGSAKCWLPERFAEVGDRLVESIMEEISRPYLARCVIFGGKGEERLGQDIALRMQHQPILLSGKTTIQGLLQILNRCSLLVTNDTGPMHLARALDVPIVAIFGSTNPLATGPWGLSQAVVQASVRCAPCLLRSCPIDHRCMTQVSIEQVVEVGIAQFRTSKVFMANGRAKGNVG